MADQPEIGIICLGEAGNLGDDLILAAAVQSVHRSVPEATVRYLSHGQHLDWSDLRTALDLPGSTALVRVDSPRAWPWVQRDRLFEGSDALIVGGGGLIQSVHHPYRPFQWFDNLPARTSTPVMGIGLGIGPLTESWQEYFRSRSAPFDLLMVRDDESRAFAVERLGWRAERCLDFVDDAFLHQLAPPKTGPHGGPKTLGVSVRAWPGLHLGDMAAHIARVCARYSIDRVRFYVLESKNGSGVDEDFVRALQRHLVDKDSDIVSYLPGRMREFVKDMSTCQVAIGMKLHACAIWAAWGVPVYPIVYAPKVASFYGVPYTGLAVFDKFLTPSEKWTSDAISASDAIAQNLRQMMEARDGGRALRFTSGERWRFRISAAAVDTSRKIRRALGG